MTDGLPSDGLPADDPRVIAARVILADAFDRIYQMGLLVTTDCGYSPISVSIDSGEYGDDIQFFEYDDTERSVS